MDECKVYISEVEAAYKKQLESASYIRALTDDFSFLDSLIKIHGGNEND